MCKYKYSCSCKKQTKSSENNKTAKKPEKMKQGDGESGWRKQDDRFTDKRQR